MTHVRMNALVTLKKIDPLIMEGRPIIWGLDLFTPFSKKNQYLVNGESNQKIVTSKKDAEFNSGPNPPH